jgi:hypothetical protein
MDDALAAFFVLCRPSFVGLSRTVQFALDAQRKAEMVSAFGSQQELGVCRFQRALDAIHPGGGFEGDKDVARVNSEGAVKFGV